MVGLEMWEVVDFGRDVYGPLRVSVGVEVMCFVGYVKIGWGPFVWNLSHAVNFLSFSHLWLLLSVTVKKESQSVVFWYL